MENSICHILVIDDDENYKKILKVRLGSFMPKMEIDDYADLATARVALKANVNKVYDLVILDEHLPDGRGVELLKEGWFEDLVVFTITSDTEPETTRRVLEAGAVYFLSKHQISDPLFKYLIQGTLDRNRIQKQLTKSRLDQVRIDTVRTLASTLRHEINNPLGAVLGAAYLMQHSKEATQEQIEAAQLVEDSGKRIKHVLDQLCDAIEFDSVKKANQNVFHIPGDAPWDDKPKK